MFRLQGARLIEGGRTAQARREIVEIDQKVIPALFAGGRGLESEHGARVTDAEQRTTVLMQPACAADDVTTVSMFLVIRLAERKILGQHLGVADLRKRPQTVGMARFPG